MIMTEVFRRHGEKPLLIRRALVFQAIMEQTPIAIHDHELIVGGVSEKRRSAFLVPETNVQGLDLKGKYTPLLKKGAGRLIDAAAGLTTRFNPSLGAKFSAANLLLEQELDTVENRSTQRFRLGDAEKKDIVSTILPFWRTRDAISLYRSTLPREQQKLMNRFLYAAEHQFVGGIYLFHPNIEQVVHKGLNAVIQDAEKRKAELTSPGGTDAAKRDFYEAAILSCRAVIRFAQRHADLAQRMAQEASPPERKAELLEIARICRHVPAHRPRNFQEALQSLWFTYLAVLMDDGGHEVPFGRWDQALFPLYQEDTEKEDLTRGKALELLEAFLLKTNEIEFLLHNKARLFEDGNSGRLTLTLGGMDENGHDATNPVSYLFLEALSNIRMIRPNPAVRLHRHTPEDFLHQVTDIMAGGANTVQVFNDEAIIKGFTDAGFTEVEARNYIITGCVQPIPRSTYGSVCAAHLVLPRALETYIRQSNAPSSFDMFLTGYKSYLSGLVKNMTHTLQLVDTAHQERLPNTFVSALVDGPLETGRDVKSGGARNNLTGIALLGLGTAVDSLMAIRQVIFEERKFSFTELKRMLKADFVGFEAQRLYLLNKPPKYGNDDDRVDGMARDLTDFIALELKAYRTFRGGRYSLGAHSENGHVVFGFVTGATPDGRKQLEPYSIGAAGGRGREKKGYTAALKSFSKINPTSVISGASVNIRMNPGMFHLEENLRRFQALLKAYFFQLNGQNLQTTVVSGQALKEAQQHPERYPDLLVRISGYSARFIDLTRFTQDEIIARTEHGN